MRKSSIARSRLDYVRYCIYLYTINVINFKFPKFREIKIVKRQWLL